MAKDLTDVKVRTAKPGITWDGRQTGLGIKVLPSGARVWVMMLKWPGRKAQTRKNIGHYPTMTLEAARERAGQLYAAAKSGIDPFEEERQRAEAERREREAAAEHTFAAVAERYIAERNNRRAAQDAREIRRLLVSEWGDKAIKDIGPDDVIALIEKIMRRAPYDAKNAFGHASGIFKFAVFGWQDKDGRRVRPIAVSPVASVDKKRLFASARIEPRQRVLGDDEVLALWRASDRAGYPAGPAYKLLMLTGCRVSEVARARWSELHPELRRVIREAARKGQSVDWADVPPAHKRLTIPRERFKSDAEHVVQLTDDACRVLEGLPRFAGSDWLFTSTGRAPTWLGAKHKQRLDARMRRTLRALARRRGDDPTTVRLEGWVQHDLRRVVRTNLSALGVDDHVAEMVLGHGRKGLQRVYDQHRYEPQIRHALELWAAKLREIVQPPSGPPATVVSIASRRRA